MLRMMVRFPDSRLLFGLLVVSLVSFSMVMGIALPFQGMGQAGLTGLHLDQSKEYLNLGPSLDAARYQFIPDTTRAGSWAPNLAHGFEVRLGDSGVSIQQSAGDWELALELASISRGVSERLLPSTLSAGISPSDPARFEYIYGSGLVAESSSVKEWFNNSASGLEHGLTIYEALPQPGDIQAAPLVLHFAYQGDLKPLAAPDKGRILFLDAAGLPRLVYEKLQVYDSTGRRLPAFLDVEATGLTIAFEDQDALYPVFIDPLFTQQTAKVTASDGGTDDYFGYAAALDQDTALIGAPGSYITGTLTTNDAAYIYYRNSGGSENWGEIARLVPPDGDATQRFGFSVDISGDIAVVGAPLYDLGGNPNAGAAYIFYRNEAGGDNWGFVTRLTAGLDGAQGDRYGRSVAISGDTIVVGAPFYDSIAGGDNAGKVYIYQRNQGGADQWGLVTSLYPGDPLPGDRFGFHVDINGDTIAIGSPYTPDEPPDTPLRHAGAVYIFERNQGGPNTWGQVRMLTGSAPVNLEESYFGWSLALEHDRLVVGVPGYNNWQGLAFVFSRNQGGANQWGQVTSLSAGEPVTGGSYAWTVAITNELIAVGVANEANTAVLNGSVFLYEQNLGGPDAWQKVTKLVASDSGAGNNFGQSLALDNSGILVGANVLDVAGQTDQGAAYFFYRTGSTWTPVASPDAFDGASGDRFGEAADLDGDFLVVGAPLDNGPAGDDQGAVYVFYRNQSGMDGWGQVRKITAPDGAAGDRFGASIALSIDKVVVGAPRSDISARADQGAAYVFSRNQGGADNWGFVRKLTASDGAAGDLFGTSVTIEIDHIASGAPGDSAGSGSTYLFERNTGGVENWGQVRKLTAADALGLGKAVELANDRLLVGAPQSTVGTNLTQGAAYVYARNQGGSDVWGQVSRLVAPDGASGDLFGTSVALSPGVAAVGAPVDDSSRGAVYLYYRNQGGLDHWGYTLRRTAQDRVTGGLFGTSINMTEDFLACGAPGQNAVYTFQRNRTGPDQWGQFIKVLAADILPGDQFGQVVALSGRDLVAGAPAAGLNDPGEAFMYRLAEFFEDLSISKTATPTRLAPGNPVQFVIDFANNGDAEATGIVITDTLPAVLTNPVFTSSGVGLTQVAPMVWQAADMPPGASGTLTITATVAAGTASGDFANQVEIVAVDPDINPGNNSAAANFTVDADAPLPPVLRSPANGFVTTVRNLTLEWQASPSSDVAGYLLSFNGNLVDVGLLQAYLVTNLTNGVYQWRVAAYDLVGNIGNFTSTWSITVQTSVQNIPPIADPGSPQVVLVGEQVTLDGSGSSDPDNHLPLSFVWTQTAGIPLTLANPNQAIVTFTAPTSPGILTFQLQVRDFLGLASTASVNITVTSYKLSIPIVQRE
jgi:uncharacterized repeat protein (TIGR01451 family)